MLELRHLSSPILLPDAADQAIAANQGGAVLHERRFLGKLLLHVDAGNDQRDAIASAGVAVPLPPPGSASTGDELCILSLAPDAYLLITPPNAQYRLLPRLRAALSGRPAAVVDVSSHYATVRLSGAAAAELIYRGCSASVEPPDFTTGRCMTSKISKFAVIIHRIDCAPTFDLHVTRSLAASFWRWLAEAGRDCALQIRGRAVHDSEAHPTSGSLPWVEPT